MRYHVEGRGPAFLMVPGLDGTALLFYRQIPRLAPRFRVVSFELPDDPRVTMDELVAAVHDVVVRLSPRERVILCGESFGGALSLSYARRHPESLRGLVILNSFARVRQRLGLHIGPPLLRLVPWGAMSLVRRFTGSRLHTSTTNEEDLRQFAERSRAIGKAGYIRRLEILRRYDLREELPRIETPTLFLAAEEDHLVDAVREARFMASRMPHAEVHTLPGFGHICLIHHDFDLASTIAPWIERSLTPPSTSPSGARDRNSLE